MEGSSAKFTSREYTIPVQAANDMAERLGQNMINRYNEQTSKYLLEFSREKTKMLDTLKQISEKTIDFGIESFRKERKRLLKPPPPPDMLIPKKIIQAVPANCVLDFGPGNTIMYYGGDNNKKGVISRNSVITNPHKRKMYRPRPFTAIPGGIKRQQSVSKSGRNTSLGFVGSSGRNSSLEMSMSSPRNTSTRLAALGFNRRDSVADIGRNEIYCEESPGVEYNHGNSHKWEMPNRSYRKLKTLYTYTEEEKPDLTVERFKIMKLRETMYFQCLQERVKAFRV